MTPPRILVQMCTRVGHTGLVCLNLSFISFNFNIFIIYLFCIRLDTVENLWKIINFIITYTFVIMDFQIQNLD